MRYKVVPTPADRALLADVHEALPLVPGSVEDCCTRIRDRTSVPSRDEAREWLTFATALGLASETDRGYHRVRDPLDDETLADNVRTNVFGVEEVLTALRDSDGRPNEAAVFDAVRDIVPRWERDRHADWESEWTDRIDRLLSWCVAFDLVVHDGSGYAPA